MAGLGIAATVVGAIAVAALAFGAGRAQLSGAGVLYTALPSSRSDGSGATSLLDFSRRFWCWWASS